MSLFSRQRPASLFATVRSDDIAHLAGLLDDGSVTPAADRIWPLEQVTDAVRHVQSGHATGKTKFQVGVDSQPRDEVGRSTASTSG